MEGKKKIPLQIISFNERKRKDCSFKVWESYPSLGVAEKQDLSPSLTVKHLDWGTQLPPTDPLIIHQKYQQLSKQGDLKFAYIV